MWLQPAPWLNFTEAAAGVTYVLPSVFFNVVQVLGGNFHTVTPARRADAALNLEVWIQGWCARARQ